MNGVKRRGAALFFVLILTAVMASMMAAFVAINRQQFALTADAASRQLAYDACISGLNYVQAQLENNSNWGNAAFPAATATFAYPPGQSMLTITRHGDGATGEPNPATNFIEGDIRTMNVECSFIARISNNLDNANPLTAPSPGPPLGEVPGRAVRVQIVGRANRVSRRLDVVLRKRAFTNSSNHTERELKVEAKIMGWSIESKDPINQIRANGDIFAPDPLKNPDSLFKFNGMRGTAKAGGDVHVEKPGGGYVNLAQDSTTRLEVEKANRANGRMQSKAPPVPVPELKKEQLNVPEPEITLPPGSYKTGQAKETVWREVTLTHDDNGNPLVPIQTKWRRCELTVPTLVHPDGTEYAYKDPLATPSEVFPRDDRENPGADGWDRPVQVDQDGMVELGSAMVDTNGDGAVDTEKKVCFDIPGAVMSIPPGVTAKVNGDLLLGSDYYGGAATNNVTLLMGFDMDTFQTSGGSFQRNTSFGAPGLSKLAAMGAMNEKGGAIMAGGDIHVSGSCYGLGSLSTEAKLRLSAPTGMSTTPNVGLAVRANDKMEMMPPPAVRTGAALMVDGPVFDRAMDAADASYNKWAGFETMPTEDRVAARNLLGGQTVKNSDGTPMSPAAAWNLMRTELNKPPANTSTEPLNSMGSTLTIKEYVRLREAMRSADNKWLTDPTYSTRADSVLESQVVLYNWWAREKEGLGAAHLKTFMDKGANCPDMYFRGLVYSGLGGLLVDAKENSFFNEGAMVSRGDIKVINSTQMTSMYNRAFLDDILKPQNSSQVRLEAVYFNIQ